MYHKKQGHRKNSYFIFFLESGGKLRQREVPGHVSVVMVQVRDARESKRISKVKICRELVWKGGIFLSMNKFLNNIFTYYILLYFRNNSTHDHILQTWPLSDLQLLSGSKTMGKKSVFLSINIHTNSSTTLINIISSHNIFVLTAVTALMPHTTPVSLQRELGCLSSSSTLSRCHKASFSWQVGHKKLKTS